MTPWRLTWRLVWKGALIWSAVVALVIATGIATYKTMYATEAARQLGARELGGIRAFAALYGQPTALDTPGGFLVWRYGGSATVVVALWALLTVTRLLRGDEERGRTDLLIASPLSNRSLLGAQLGTFALTLLIVAAATFTGCVASGLPPGGSALLGLMISGGGLLFGAFAAVTSQLFSTRRRAAGWVGAFLGASFLVRAMADSSPNRTWWSWLSPLGWTERVAPFGQPSLLAMALVFIVSAAMGALAVALRSRRDADAGIITGRRQDDEHERPLRSTMALDWRLTRGTVIAWAGGLSVAGLVLGLMASDVIDYFNSDPNVRDLAARFGGSSMTTVDAFLGLLFVIVGVVLAVYAGSQIVAGREEEVAGHIEELLSAGTTRWGWLRVRVAVATATTVLLALVTGVAGWCGTALAGNPASIWGALRGSLNAVPVALLFGGLAVFVFGLLPRATALVTFGGITIAYIVQTVGAVARAPSWILDVSPFTHVAPVPAAPANLTASAVMVVIGLALFGAGGWAFHRRDLASA